MEEALLNYYIYNNDITSTCNFIPDKINKGTVIYEVIRIIDGKPLFFNEHFKRFTCSLKACGYNDKISKENLLLQIKNIIEINGVSDCNIKFQIRINSDGTNDFSIWISPFYYPNKELYKNGISLITTSYQRDNPNIKVYNSEFKNRISKLIHDKEVYEALLVTKDELITEGSKSNIFFTKDDEIYTPKLENVLGGITRQKVIHLSKSQNIKLHETDIYIEELPTFESAFLCGTSPKILPIKLINDQLFNTHDDLVQKLMIGYNDIILDYIKSFSWDK